MAKAQMSGAVKNSSSAPADSHDLSAMLQHTRDTPTESCLNPIKFNRQRWADLSDSDDDDAFVPAAKGPVSAAHDLAAEMNTGTPRSSVGSVGSAGSGTSGASGGASISDARVARSDADDRNEVGTELIDGADTASCTASLASNSGSPPSSKGAASTQDEDLTEKLRDKRRSRKDKQKKKKSASEKTERARRAEEIVSYQIAVADGVAVDGVVFYGLAWDTSAACFM
jgi:hypothetical protein